MIWRAEFDHASANESRIEHITRTIFSDVSTNEIKSLFNRVNFYLEHFTIISRKRLSEAVDNKVNYLKNLNKALKQEIEHRQCLCS